ncbi:hypothetical protein AMS68_004631 [Peltaster fructicola]|uniref:UPF3 domain-containing protein n=1 Tax=Peltaster fructicola TaxID=286661 RepID=A0A6H0XWK9_9PEZI|nr:hypothetical protein AMS68_004631 [Peltaster fructicola]
MPPKAAASRAERAGGVLAVSAAARAASVKQPASRLKLEIRRLPPGLTLIEFEETLGEEWKLGRGKVDWREYRQGKIKSPGKLPEQSRCYVHIVNEALVKEFEQRFLAVVFHDKAGTHKNPELKFLPPTLGHAPNQRVPLLTKPRHDNRQGTIDQDPEFIAFLEAETQPIVKPAALNSTNFDRDEPKAEVRSTPLIDDLREKKANKAKAAASKAEKKGHKRGESKDAAPPGKVTGKGKEKVDAKKIEGAAKDAAKAPNKQAAAKSAASQASTAQASAASPAKKKRESRSRHRNLLLPQHRRKDLGIKPKDGAPSSNSARSKASAPSTTQATASTAPTTTRAAAKTPIVATTETVQPTPPPLKAFLKHANPSQGMTEDLIQQTLSQYGDVTKVSIDPRKGTAVAVFGSQEGLQKAIGAKKVTVASGAVEILEFKDRGGGAGGNASRGAPSRGRVNRRGGASTAPATTPGAPA